MGMWPLVGSNNISALAKQEVAGYINLEVRGLASTWASIVVAS